MPQGEPCFDVAHLGHVELLTNRPEESLDFFVNVYGLTESGREGDSVYLRAWDDYEFHTLKLTAAKTTGMAHCGYRTSSPQALERRVKVIEAMGLGIGWTEGDLGHGRSYRFNSPDGHVFELYWETKKYRAPDGEAPALKNIAQRYHARGVAPRRLDHFNLLASDVSNIRDFMVKALGSRVTEQILLDNGRLGGCWFTVNNKGYDMACTEDHAGAKGPLPPHHIRGRPPRGHPARRRHLSRERRLHRDRAAQARDPGHVLPLRLRAGGKPRRGGECRCPPDSRP